MCTALTLSGDSFYFGRTLDLEMSFNEKVVIIPRNFSFSFREASTDSPHAAIIGMATIKNGYPLLYDGTNEWGLSMAGLNFPDNAFFPPRSDAKTNIAPFEFIPYILSKCKTVTQAKDAIKEVHLADIDFDDDYHAAPLHWIIADAYSAITVEPTKEGLKVYENPLGILTNNPPFPYHMTNLNNYMALSPLPPDNNFSREISFETYSRGMGTLGLPGDSSSASRFVRAAFYKYNAKPLDFGDIPLFFRIMASIEQTKGSVILQNRKEVISVYTSCCDTQKGIYYYKTYESGINAIDMKKVDTNQKTLFSFKLIKEPNILYQN